MYISDNLVTYNFLCFLPTRFNSNFKFCCYISHFIDFIMILLRKIILYICIYMNIKKVYLHIFVFLFLYENNSKL